MNCDTLLLLTIMVINLLCTEKYLVNAFPIKYYQIHNILYGRQELPGLSRVKANYTDG